MGNSPAYEPLAGPSRAQTGRGTVALNRQSEAPIVSITRCYNSI